MGDAPTARDHGSTQEGEAGPELVQAWGEVVGLAGIAGGSARAWFATPAGVAVAPAVALPAT
ncbi:MAG TPA: hypothetical protein VKK19_14560 [Candidatus Dormibacteraeota bacterium]|nr:hypothetical protein [Candidatus Dormibacteraeota bacterium]